MAFILMPIFSGVSWLISISISLWHGKDYMHNSILSYASTANRPAILTCSLLHNCSLFMCYYLLKKNCTRCGGGGGGGGGGARVRVYARRPLLHYQHLIECPSSAPSPSRDNTLARARTNTHIHWNTRASALTPAPSQSLTHWHTCRHARTRPATRTHARAHTYVCPCEQICALSVSHSDKHDGTYTLAGESACT